MVQNKGCHELYNLGMTHLIGKERLYIKRYLDLGMDSNLVILLNMIFKIGPHFRIYIIYGNFVTMLKV